MTALEWKQVQKRSNSGVRKNSSGPQRRRVTNIQDEVFLFTFPAEENWHEESNVSFGPQRGGRKADFAGISWPLKQLSTDPCLPFCDPQNDSICSMVIKAPYPLPLVAS